MRREDFSTAHPINNGSSHGVEFNLTYSRYHQTNSELQEKKLSMQSLLSQATIGLMVHVPEVCQVKMGTTMTN